MCKSNKNSHESWSSTSPPRAPAPTSFVVDLPSINTVNPLADMLQKREQIQREQEQIQRKQEQIQREQEQIQRERELLENAEERIKQDIQKYLSNLSKNCFIDISINRVMCDERVLIKLFDELAPITCDAFRTICSNRYGFSYENSQLNYLLPNNFIKGGQVIVYGPEGIRLPDRTGPKEKSTMIHDRKGLISMDPTKSLNEFIITLGPAPMLNDSYVVFGEIISGMNQFELINVQGVRDMTDTDGGGEPVDSICIYSCGDM